MGHHQHSEHVLDAKAVGARIRVDGTKWILDGTPVERGAALGRPYGDDPATCGRENFSAAEVREMLRENLALGEPLLLHAIGWRTLETVLDCVESFGPEIDWRAAGLRIEHGDGLSPSQIGRVKALGLVVTQNPTHFLLPQAYGPRFGAAAPYAAFRSLFDAGVPMAIGSDGPLNPFLGLFAAIVHPSRPEEAATLEEALIAYTYGSAVAEGQGERKGRLRPGAAADLAVLSQDIFTLPPQALAATCSLLTMVNGAVVYEAR
jgi:predicted amidohydrolase YtcJ